MPDFTDQELVTVRFYDHGEGGGEKKKMHRLIKYCRGWFPRLHSYLQRARKVRSTDALIIHCWGNWQSLTFSSFLTTDSHNYGRRDWVIVATNVIACERAYVRPHGSTEACNRGH